MNKAYIRDLLIDAVDAKLAYWDANRALEKALMDGSEDISDYDADVIHEHIELLASCVNEGSDTTFEHVDDMLEMLQDLPTTQKEPS